MGWDDFKVKNYSPKGFRGGCKLWGRERNCFGMLFEPHNHRRLRSFAHLCILVHGQKAA